MPKFRVHYEASAAIGIEIEVEAEDEDEAGHKADALKLNLSLIADELLKPDPIAVEAYAKTTGQPITHVTVEEDENGFEQVDVFEPEGGI